MSERDDAWDLFLEALRREGTVREVAPGRVQLGLETNEGDPWPVILVVSPAGWEEILDSWGTDADSIDELVGSRIGNLDEDERYVVAWKGDLRGSIREELPPVRGPARERLVSELRAQDPSGEFGWFAYAPENTEEEP